MAFGDEVKVSVLEVNGVDTTDGPEEVLLEADKTKFDPTRIPSLGFTKTNTQEAIEEAVSGAGTGIVLPIIGGKNGNLTAGSYANNEENAMNNTLVILPMKGIKLLSVSVLNDNTVTGDVKVQRYDTGTASFIDMYTVSLSSESDKVARGLSVSFPDEALIAYKTEVALQNCKIIATFKGDSAI
jgi:hypothetical protein